MFQCHFGTLHAHVAKTHIVVPGLGLKSCPARTILHYHFKTAHSFTSLSPGTVFFVCQMKWGQHKAMIKMCVLQRHVQRMFWSTLTSQCQMRSRLFKKNKSNVFQSHLNIKCQMRSRSFEKAESNVFHPKKATWGQGHVNVKCRSIWPGKSHTSGQWMQWAPPHHHSKQVHSQTCPRYPVISHSYTIIIFFFLNLCFSNQNLFSW